MNPPRPDIFEYDDFRPYLKDLYLYTKRINPKFSYRLFAKRVGIPSSAYLPLLIDGRRNLVNGNITRVALAFRLTKEEHQYFEALVQFSQAKDQETRRYYSELLRNIRKDKVGRPLSDEKYEYVSRWYYPAIRELAFLPGFTDDPPWIRRMLKNRISLHQAKEAVEVLLRLGLIAKDEGGRHRQTDAGLITDDDIVHAAAYAFHQQMLSLAKETLSTAQQHEREVTGITMALSSRQYGEVKRIIRDFQQSIARYITSNPDVPEAVYQLNTQLFSLTAKA